MGSNRAAICRALAAALVFIVLGLAPGAPLAQSLSEMQTREELWTLRLDDLRSEIDSGEVSSAQSAEIRQLLEGYIQQASSLQAVAEQRLGPLRAQLDALGPPPAEGEPPEDTETEQARQTLNEEIAAYQGLIQRANAASARAQAQLRDLSSLSSRQTAALLMERGPAPVHPGTWGPALGQANQIWINLSELAGAWWQAHRPASQGWTPYLIVLSVLVVTVTVSRTTRLALERRYGQRPDIQQPSYPRAVLAFGITGMGRAISPSLIALLVWLTLKEVGLITEEIEPVSRGLLIAVVVYALIGQLSRAALAPARPQWSIVPLDRAQTIGAGLSMHALAILMAVIAGLNRAAEALTVPAPELAGLATLLSNGGLVLLIAPLLGNWLWRRPQLANVAAEAVAEDEPKETDESAGPLGFGLRVLRLVLILALAAVVVSAALGYRNISIELLDGLLATAVTIAFGLMLRTVVVELLDTLLSAQRHGVIARQLDLSEGGSESLLFWLTLLVDTFLILVAIPLILFEWGVPETVLSYWFSQISTGITIGDFTFEPLAIIYALVVFVLALVSVRFLKRLLNQRILSRTRLDVGARHSISAAVGYVGFAIAAMAAVATLGLDLSNLAIIAGALSVGIGVGLQNVVNNFVSGLLLLIERPIKVGDWIVVAGYEGTVKRISVRSTEIETFDRSEVILPNSELVSGPVTNWTHKTRICRVIIPVGVAYGSDTQLVHDLLMKAARDHKDVLSFPAPIVLFKAFGNSSLDFELRVYARDTDYYLTLINDMHFAIDKLFRENSIEIPFPQRDLHLRDSDTLAEVLRGGVTRKVTASQAEAAKGEQKGSPSGNGNDGD